MSNWLFSGITMLEKGLDAAFLRNKVIANNIANIDTPAFKSSRVEFESILKSAIEKGSLEGKKTNPKHLDIGSARISDIQPVVYKNNNTSLRMDGNNVDIDAEMAELSRNTILYNALTEITGRELTRIKTAIKEVR